MCPKHLPKWRDLCGFWSMILCECIDDCRMDINCNVNINQCQLDSCMNGGTCIDLVSILHANATNGNLGFTGKDCNTKTDIPNSLVWQSYLPCFSCRILIYHVLFCLLCILHACPYNDIWCVASARPCTHMNLIAYCTMVANVQWNLSMCNFSVITRLGGVGLVFYTCAWKTKVSKACIMMTM